MGSCSRLIGRALLRRSSGSMGLKQKPESIGTLSYNGRTGTLCIGRGVVVDWYQIAGRLVQETHRFVLPYSIVTLQNSI